MSALVSKATLDTIALTAKFLLEQHIEQRGSKLKVVGHKVGVAARGKPANPDLTFTLKLWDPSQGPMHRTKR